MAISTSKPSLIVIVGPTASGKSDLAMRVAKEFNGEIIAADSRTIYRGMDIGTAKPSKEDQKNVQHWGIDLVEPGEVFSAHRFKKYAEEKIKDIQERGKLPILVGGTGLYVDSVLFDFDFVETDISQRAELEKLTTEELQALIREKGYKMPENFQNRRHLLRTIERKGQMGSKKQIRGDVLLTGLMPLDTQLRKRIDDRAEQMFDNGVIEETETLIQKYGEQNVSKTNGIIYKICQDLLSGKIDLSMAKEKFKKADWQYARRQKTWFRRNKFIHWFDNPEEAFVSVSKALNN